MGARKLSMIVPQGAEFLYVLQQAQFEKNKSAQIRTDDNLAVLERTSLVRGLNGFLSHRSHQAIT